MIDKLHIDQIDTVTQMVLNLWPDCNYQEEKENLERIYHSEKEQIFVWMEERHIPSGFIYMALRNYAEGAQSSPVGYIEGIYVKPEYRKQGIGRLLVEAGEAWTVQKGCSEMASDALIENINGQEFHQALGYCEISRIVCYRKHLSDQS